MDYIRLFKTHGYGHIGCLLFIANVWFNISVKGGEIMLMMLGPSSCHKSNTQWLKYRKITLKIHA